MLYVSFGLEKAGSTLTYSLTRKTLEQAGHPHIALSAADRHDFPKNNPEEHRPDSGRGEYSNNVNVWHPDVVHAAERATPANRILTLRTHDGPDRSIAEAVEEGRALVHVAIRDLRDIALSLIDVVARKQILGWPDPSGISIGEIRSTFPAIEFNLAFLDQWSSMPGTLVLHYEDTAFAPERSISAICSHLNLEVPPSSFEVIFSQAVANPANKRNVAESKRHTREMNAEDQAMVLAHFAPFYEKFMPGAAVEVGPVLVPRQPKEMAAEWLRQSGVGAQLAMREARLAERAAWLAAREARLAAREKALALRAKRKAD